MQNVRVTPVCGWVIEAESPSRGDESIHVRHDGKMTNSSERAVTREQIAVARYVLEGCGDKEAAAVAKNLH